MNLKDTCAIVGIGFSEFGKKVPKSTMTLTLEGCKRAIEDAGLTKDDVDGLLVVSPVQEGERHGWVCRLCSYLGISSTFSAGLDIGGATPIAMVQLATMAINAGMCNTVVCCYGWQNSPMGIPLSMPPGLDFTAPYGDLAALPFKAQVARRHMHLFGTTSRQMGAVAVAFRRHACMNPAAQMYEKGPITIEDHQNSRIIVEPLRLLDNAPITDSGGAVVVTSAERAIDLKHRPVYVSGMGQAHSGEFMRPWRDPRYPEGTFEGGKAADIALDMAGITRKDIDVAQFYDGFTILVIIELEAYGFCKPGEGGPFVEEGRLELGRELPSNTAGGLLSEGHLMGMGHVAEAVRQLRGECGERQVKDSEVAFVSGYGGAPHEYPISFSYSTLILTR